MSCTRPPDPKGQDPSLVPLETEEGYAVYCALVRPTLARVMMRYVDNELAPSFAPVEVRS